MTVLSQQSSIRVYGNVTENNKKLPGAVITLYANGSLLKTVVSDNGKYELNLELGVDYVITYTKPGFITKRIEFNTKNVPPDRAKNLFSDFPIDIDIFPEVPGTDIDKVLMQPIGKILFDKNYEKVGDFQSDEAYHRSIQNALDQIEAARKDAEEKQKAIDAQYKKLISKADGEFNTQKYTDAQPDYQAASQLKPGEQYPKDQLAKIDAALKQANADAGANAAAKAAQTKYDSLMKIGDNAFASKTWDNARSAYNAALKVKPNEQHPKDQLAAIDKAIADAKNVAAANAIKAKYDSLMKIGDAAFATKTWDNAKAAYTSALQVKPNEQRPKDQLQAINQAMALDKAQKDKHVADSIAAAKKAADDAAAALAAKNKHAADSIAAAKKAAADAAAALAARNKHIADSTAAAKKAADDAAAALAAKNKHAADSIAAAKKAAADAAAALAARNKHIADSTA
ncbi:MAG TPA: hypothetical protein VNY36_01055, partial [Bacteroidia bacterium]|nr:hypothetical protein [Bacteroidia bacterium]